MEIPATAEFRSRWAAERDLSYEPLKPDLVCEVAFLQWTEGGHIRHPSFQGMRPDKPARDARREQPPAGEL